MEALQPDLNPSRPLPISWETYVEWLEPRWRTLLDSDPQEREVQDFLEAHPVLLPGAFGDVGPGGHHGPALGGVFCEPPLRGLGKGRTPDFMWITRSTSLITPICIEIERPGKYWFTADGNSTAEFTQAHGQLAEWKLWFAEPENQAIFRKTYLNGEWEDRQLLPQYVLIYGRAREFDVAYGRHRAPGRLRKIRDHLRRENEQFMTFDSLRPIRDVGNCVSMKMTSDGPALWSTPPSFTTGPLTASVASIMRHPYKAIMKTPLWTQGRKDYVASRWLYWQKISDAGGGKFRSTRMGE